MTGRIQFVIGEAELGPRELALVAVHRLLIRLTLASPRRGLRVAEAYGRWGSRLLPRIYNPPDEDRSRWIRLTGIEDRKALRKMRVERSGRQWRRKVLESVLSEGGLECLLPLVRWESAEHITDLLEAGRPVIAATWHAGPYPALGLGMLSFQRPVTFLVGRKGKPTGIKNLEAWEIGTPKDAILTFRNCSDRLQKGGILAMTGDQPAVGGEGFRVRLLNAHILLKRGMPALSRRNRAPVVPVGITWSPTGDLLFKAHPPLPTTLRPCEDPETYEEGTLREFAEIVDAYFRLHPEEIEEGLWRGLVRKRNFAQSAEPAEADPAPETGICRAVPIPPRSPVDGGGAAYDGLRPEAPENTSADQKASMTY